MFFYTKPSFSGAKVVRNINDNKFFAFQFLMFEITDNQMHAL